MDSIAQGRYRRQPAPLSEALARFMSPGPTGLSQRYETAGKLQTLWTQLLPTELAQHCRIVDFSKGLISVEADSPSFLYELRISSQEIVQYLRQACPSAKVKAIKVILAG